MPKATPFTPVDGNGRIIGAASDASGNPQGSLANPTYERSVGSPSMATGQVASSLSPAAAVQIVAARSGRRSVTITNVTGSQPVYLGASGVTTATGFFLAGTVGASVTLPSTAAVFATAPTTAQTLSFIENY